jgi:hypothetical protein
MGQVWQFVDSRPERNAAWVVVGPPGGPGEHWQPCVWLAGASAGMQAGLLETDGCAWEECDDRTRIA